MRSAVAALAACRRTDGAVRGLTSQRRAAVESHPFTLCRRVRRNLRQPLRNRLRPRFDDGVALEVRRLQRRVPGQSEFIELLQIIRTRDLSRCDQHPENHCLSHHASRQSKRHAIAARPSK